MCSATEDSAALCLRPSESEWALQRQRTDLRTLGTAPLHHCNRVCPAPKPKRREENVVKPQTQINVSGLLFFFFWKFLFKK